MGGAPELPPDPAGYQWRGPDLGAFSSLQVEVTGLGIKALVRGDLCGGGGRGSSPDSQEQDSPELESHYVCVLQQVTHHLSLGFPRRWSGHDVLCFSRAMGLSSAITSLAGARAASAGRGCRAGAVPAATAAGRGVGRGSRARSRRRQRRGAGLRTGETAAGAAPVAVRASSRSSPAFPLSASFPA